MDTEVVDIWYDGLALNVVWIYPLLIYTALSRADEVVG
jgi:hypothetical protein